MKVIELNQSAGGCQTAIYRVVLDASKEDRERLRENLGFLTAKISALFCENDLFSGSNIFLAINKRGESWSEIEINLRDRESNKARYLRILEDLIPNFSYRDPSTLSEEERKKFRNGDLLPERISCGHHYLGNVVTLANEKSYCSTQRREFRNIPGLMASFCARVEAEIGNRLFRVQAAESNSKLRVLFKLVVNEQFLFSEIEKMISEI